MERGRLAVEDMKARIRSGWTVEMLWERLEASERSDAPMRYDYAGLVEDYDEAV